MKINYGKLIKLEIMNLAFISPCILHKPVAEHSGRFQQWGRKRTVTCSSSSASLLKSNESPDCRFLDLRTMQTARWDSSDVPQGLDNERGHVERKLMDEDILFTNETVALSRAEKEAVRALLAGQSVLFHTSASESLKGLIVDLALRAKLWGQTVVYCAPSLRAAEVMYSSVCVQLGQQCEVVLDVGASSLLLQNEEPDTKESLVTSRGSSSPNTNLGSSSGPRTDAPCLTITVGELAARRLMFRHGNLAQGVEDVFVLDTFIHDDPVWEEIILSMPKHAKACVIGRGIDCTTGEHLLSWIHSVIGSVVPVFSSRGTCVPAFKTESLSVPIPRTFIFNAAMHSNPIEVSLPLLRELAQKDQTRNGIDYGDALLRDVTVLEAVDPETLLFRSAIEAEYADMASLLLHDGARTFQTSRQRGRRRTQQKRSRTPSSLSAARKRRETVFAESRIFPALAVLQGRLAVASTVEALLNATDNNSLFLWDEGSRDHLHDVLRSFLQNREQELSMEDHEHVSYLARGIGILHSGVLPSVRMLALELFRAGLVPVIIVDSYLGRNEICSLPTADTIIVQSSALAEVDDAAKGLISGSTIMSLAGRGERTGSGNLIVTWYDESVTESDAVSELFAGLARSGIVAKQAIGSANSKRVNRRFSDPNTFFDQLFGDHRLSPNSGHMWSSYAGVLRSLRKFGLPGTKTTIERTADLYQGFMAGAIVKATREKLDVEVQAIESRLENVDWDSVAEHDRIISEQESYVRLMKSADSFRDSLVLQRTTSVLKRTRPGTVIGLSFNKDSGGSPDSRHCITLWSNLNERSELEADDGKGIMPAVFVSLLESSAHNPPSWPSNMSHAVVCILPDGAWCFAPCTDVVAVTEIDSPIVSGADMLDVPHLATFDVDSISGWGKVRAAGDEESIAVRSVVDELCELVYPLQETVRFQNAAVGLDEVADDEKMKVSLAKRSIWHGNEDKLQGLRKSRKRAAELRENEKTLRETAKQLDSALDRVRDSRRSILLKTLAVLEDCNAIRIHSDAEMEITPIGALTSHLPGVYPLFASACLLLVEDIEDLEPAEFCAFVALLVCSTQSTIQWPLSNEDTDAEADVSEELADILPERTLKSVLEIKRSFRHLQERHSNSTASEDHEVPKIRETAPMELPERMARLVFEFASGGRWREAFKQRANRSDDVLHLKTLAQVLEIIKNGGAIGEFEHGIRFSAEQALKAISRWPLCDFEDTNLLVAEGVVTKEWQAQQQSYERWWKGFNKVK